jgi:hypothetical protein
MTSLKDAGKYLSLSEAIQTLKAELLKADAIATQAHTELLALEECEIELSVEFTPKAGAGFDIYVFKAEVGAEATGSHKITVRYKPLGRIVAAALAKDVGAATLSPKTRARKRAKSRR